MQDYWRNVEAERLNTMFREWMSLQVQESRPDF
jgi:hypothetical protein